MKYRIAEVYPLTALGVVAASLSIPLNLSDVISALMIEYRVTRVADAMIEHPAANLKNISLVDGSDVLFSMTGKEAQALAFWDKSAPTYAYLSGQATVQSSLCIPINFGRKLWDKSLGLDPKMFKNPMLNISYDPALHGALDTVHQLSVQALCFDEVQPNPSGFLMSKTYATPAWVASGVWAQDVLLPTDYNIRKLVIRGYLAANYVQNVVNHVKISEDNDKKIPIDHDVSTLQKLLNLLQDEFSETLSINLTSGGLAVYCAPSYNLRISGLMLTNDVAAKLSLVNPKIPVTLTTSGNYQGQFEIVGNLPHSTIMLPFGDQDDMGDWYDTSKVSKLALRMKGGSAGSTGVVSVVTQQLRTY